MTKDHPRNKTTHERTWQDFFELMQHNPVVNHIFSLHSRGAFSSTENMLISCICMLGAQNDELMELSYRLADEQKPEVVR